MVAYIKVTVYKLLSLNIQSTLKVPGYEKKKLHNQIQPGALPFNMCSAHMVTAHWVKIAYSS